MSASPGSPGNKTGVNMGGTTAFKQEQEQRRQAQQQSQARQSSASASSTSLASHNTEPHQFGPQQHQQSSTAQHAPTPHSATRAPVPVHSPPGAAHQQTQPPQVMTTGATSQTPMFPPQQDSQAQLEQQQQQPPLQLVPPDGTPEHEKMSEQELIALRTSCKRLLIAEAILCIGMFFVFWACFVVPLVVGVLGLVASIIGVTHYGSQRDLHSNNCCCDAVPARQHIVNLQLAVIIADAFGILTSFAGVARAANLEEGNDDRIIRLVGSIICVVLSITLLVVGLRCFHLCKRIKLFAPVPQVSAVPVNAGLQQTEGSGGYMYPGTTQYYTATPQQHQLQSQHQQYGQQQPPHPGQHQQQQQNERPIVVGTIVG